MKKKLSVLALAVALAIFFVGGTTMAYLTTSWKVNNTFLSPSLTTTIYENGKPANGEFTPTKNWIEKKVTIENTKPVDTPDTAIDAYIRAMIVPCFSGGGNTTYDLQSEQILLVISKNQTVTLTLDKDWRENWFYQDNMFYHKKRVAPGAQTAPLLVKVEVSNASIWKDLTVDVLAEAIQADGGAVTKVWDVSLEQNGSITQRKRNANIEVIM